MEIRWSIQAPAPFDLASTVLGHGFHQVPPFSWDHEARTLGIALRPPLMHVAVSQPSRRPVLDVVLRTRSRRSPASLREQAGRAVARALDFDRDLAPFYDVCRTYEPLAWVPRARAGRLLRCPDLFADVVISICGTNIQWQQAVRCVHLLCRIAPSVPCSDLRCFPTPREIVDAGARHLVDTARVGYRHRSILEFCDRVLGGDIDLDLDPSMSGEDMRAFFRSLPGIGPVTARYLACLHHRTDELAVDSLVLRYIGDKYHRGRRPTVGTVEKRYAPFGDQRALAYWFEFLGDVDPVTWRGWK
jgi:3-methyladenine DNA glycosylase/8-oxoguanine DNA glycosylase